MFLCLRERKFEFWCYDGFVARLVEVKVSFENGNLIPFMARCELWDWKCYDEKFCADVVLSIVRMIMIE